MHNVSTLNQKIRCAISFPQLKSEQAIKARLDFTEHHMQLTFYPKNPTSSELIKNIFYPIKYVTPNILYMTENHSLVPPVNPFNIFLNTTEIIHRAFFEIALKTLKCDIFTIERDNNKIMKIDSIYNNFLYLRNFKNFLFSEDSSGTSSSLIYINEE